jgi:hypothetical protein
MVIISSTERIFKSFDFTELVQIKNIGSVADHKKYPKNWQHYTKYNN